MYRQVSKDSQPDDGEMGNIGTSLTKEDPLIKGISTQLAYHY